MNATADLILSYDFHTSPIVVLMVVRFFQRLYSPRRTHAGNSLRKHINLLKWIIDYNYCILSNNKNVNTMYTYKAF